MEREITMIRRDRFKGVGLMRAGSDVPEVQELFLNYSRLFDQPEQAIL